MGRPHRIDYPHSYQHVVSRGTNQWNIFLDDSDRRAFLVCLARACRANSIQVIAFCLMGNHFHLVLYCPNGNLSEAMRDLKSTYAARFNRRHGRSGPLYEGRFPSKPITDDEQLIATIRYVHRNPFDLDPNADVASFPWSSHGSYLGLIDQPAWLNVGLGLQLFDSEYRATIERPLPADKVQNGFREASTTDPPTSLNAKPSPTITVACVLREVAEAARCAVVDVRPGHSNGLIGLAAVLSADLTGNTSAEIAEPLGFRSASSVRTLVARTRKRLDHDPLLAAIFDVARTKLGLAA